MRIRRRSFLHLAVGAAAVPVASRLTWAENYPTHPVRIIVGFAAGSTTDTLARLIGQWLSQRLGQQLIVENRPGAGGNVGAEAVVRRRLTATRCSWCRPRSPPTPRFTASQLRFHSRHEPVAGVVRVPNVVEVNPAVPVKSIPELIAYAKANPGKLSFASAGIGTASHLAGQLFNKMAGVTMQHIPYRGDGPAMADLVAGNVQVGFATMTSSIGFIRAGKLRPLAVTTTGRSAALPDVPTVAEFVPGFEASSWFGVAAPKGTPADIVDSLNRQINAGLADPAIKARIADMGGMLLTGSPADFGKLIAAETDKWGKVIREAGIKAE